MADPLSVRSFFFSLLDRSLLDFSPLFFFSFFLELAGFACEIPIVFANTTVTASSLKVFFPLPSFSLSAF